MKRNFKLKLFLYYLLIYFLHENYTTKQVWKFTLKKKTFI